VPAMLELAHTSRALDLVGLKYQLPQPPVK
jgi:hypothetical protein